MFPNVTTKCKSLINKDSQLNPNSTRLRNQQQMTSRTLCLPELVSKTEQVNESCFTTKNGIETKKDFCNSVHLKLPSIQHYFGAIEERSVQVGENVCVLPKCKFRKQTFCGRDLSRLETDCKLRRELCYGYYSQNVTRSNQLPYFEGFSSPVLINKRDRNQNTIKEKPEKEIKTNNKKV